MASGYTINRSNYTLKKRRQILSGGVVYERDFMTTTNLGGWDSGSIPYGEGNFKMYYKQPERVKRDSFDGKWLKNTCPASAGSEFWTAECVGTIGAPEEEQIKIKPNYNSLLDFAYYGSCTELIKSTIAKIINTFPAEFYSTNGEIYGINDIIIENNFEINFCDEIVPEGENELRYFLKSFGKYNFISGGTVYDVLDAKLRDGAPFNPRCGIYTVDVETSAGHFMIQSVRYDNGTVVLTTSMEPGCSVRPKEDIINAFFEGLDDFSNVLLNRQTNPVYTAILDYPHETETGVETYRRELTWPKTGGWNISVDGGRYSEYLDALLSLADFYDEYYTNNLWRMLTHDPIKAMDLTFSNPEKDEDSEDYQIGTSRLEGLFWAIGRQFDEIKRAIDNVKNTANITYDGNNNIPDYFLSDVVDLGGFEVYNVDKTLSDDEETEQLFEGVTKGYTAEEANAVFLRNLRLCAKEIIKKKSTREGIESLLGLFGMISKDYATKIGKNSWDYEISEYIGVVTGSISAVTDADEVLPLEEMNSLKESAPTDTPENVFYDTLEGLPAAIRYFETESGVTKYIIPWFEKGKLYDGNLYFQAAGGWGRNSGITTEYAKYDETIKYLIVVNNVSDLINIPFEKLYDGMYVYVNEVTGEDIAEYQWQYTPSNYFTLTSVDRHEYIDSTGWKPIGESSTGSDVTITYLNTIVDDYKANNPHVGYGQYDSGEKYLNYMRNPLRYSVDLNEKQQAFREQAYDCDGKLIFEGDTFSADTVEDNMKCWYFKPSTPNGTVEPIDGEMDEVPVGMSGMTFETSAFTFDFITSETGNTGDEVTADSVINVKNLKIKFYVKRRYAADFMNFFVESILPYLRQVIPSTAIFEYEVEPVGGREQVAYTTGILNIRDVSTIVGDSDVSGTTSDDAIIDYVDRNEISGTTI